MTTDKRRKKPMKAKPYTNSDLYQLGMSGEKVDPLRVIATYGDLNNWGKHSCDKNLGNLWVWRGPVICAFELASWVKS